MVWSRLRCRFTAMYNFACQFLSLFTVNSTFFYCCFLLLCHFLSPTSFYTLISLHLPVFSVENILDRHQAGNNCISPSWDNPPMSQISVQSGLHTTPNSIANPPFLCASLKSPRSMGQRFQSSVAVASRLVHWLMFLSVIPVSFLSVPSAHFRHQPGKHCN